MPDDFTCALFPSRRPRSSPPRLLLVLCLLAVAGRAADFTGLAAVAETERLLGQRNPAEALGVIGPLLAAQPDNSLVAKALLLQGRCYLAQKQEQPALEAWAKVVASFPDSAEAPVALEKSIDLYNNSATLLDSGKAAELTQKLREAYPGSPAALRLTLVKATRLFDEMKYAEYLRYLSSPRESLPPADQERIAYAEQVVAGKPSLDFMAKYARECFVTNKVPAATRYYEEALEQFPDTLRANELKTKLGWCYYVRAGGQDRERAAALWKGVAAADARGEWAGEARWHLVQLASDPFGQWQDAVELCQGVAHDFPGTFRAEQALYMRASLLYQNGEYAKAVSAFDELIAAFPEKAKHPLIVYTLKQSVEKAAAIKAKP